MQPKPQNSERQSLARNMSYPGKRSKSVPTVAQLNEALEEVWNDRNKPSIPTAAYRLPSPFHPLQRVPSLAWHFQHAECDSYARRQGTRIESFILRVDVNGRATLVPAEESFLSRCAICAMLRKVLPFVHGKMPVSGMACLEFSRQERGLRETVLIEANHGLIAHAILVEWMSTIQGGDVVDLQVR